MIRRMTASVTLLLLLAAGARADERAPLQKLDWLIGAWEFDDSEVNGDYRETGTRVCAYGLDDQYIICKSKGVSSSGNERTYHWYINYNKVDDRFEMTSLLGNFPRKLLHTLTVSEYIRALGKACPTQQPVVIEYADFAKPNLADKTLVCVIVMSVIYK